MNYSFPTCIPILNKAFIFLGFVFLMVYNITGQNQKRADSLENIYEKSLNDDKNKISILKLLISETPDPDKAIHYSDILLKKAYGPDSLKLVLFAKRNKGQAYRSKGDPTEALKYQYGAARIAAQFKDERELGKITATIADNYGMLKDGRNAVLYYKKAIATFEKVNDSMTLGISLSNLGDTYLQMKKPDSAMVFLVRSGEIFTDLNFELGMGHNYANMGIAHAQNGYFIEAEKTLNKAIKILDKYGDYNAICTCLNYMSTIYEEKNDYLTALYFSTKSLDLATQYGLKNEISEANLKLSSLYEKSGKEGLALKHYKNYITYRDSVSNINLIQQMANQRTKFEVSEKQIKVDLLEKEAHLMELSKKKQQNFLYGSVLVTILVAMLAFGLFRRSKFIERTNGIIKAEKIRSDNLLLNILPRETAIELKTKGQVQAKKFESVTVMFADFVSFTKHSEHMTPEELVKNIGFYFSEFDKIMEKHKLEKIKTLGDAYMCAGGLPFVSKNHAERMVLAAFDILEFVDSVKKCKHSNHLNDDLHCWDIRIGINSGPVVAGVVGSKKFAFDIWGDTVNIASRMQSASDSGMINIGENTYELIKNQFDCIYRGELDVKNKGIMKMYFVKGKKETQKNTEALVKSLLAVN